MECVGDPLQPGRFGTPERTGSDHTGKGTLTATQNRAPDQSSFINDSLALVHVPVQSHRHPVLWLLLYWGLDYVRGGAIVRLPLQVQ